MKCKQHLLASHHLSLVIADSKLDLECKEIGQTIDHGILFLDFFQYYIESSMGMNG